MRHFVAAAVAAIALAWSPSACAQLAIDKLWVDFDGDRAARADILIRNESKDRYYITIVASEILGPGSDKEARIEEADPDKLGLLVTPNRLVIEPGVMRSIRIVSVNSALAADRIYRVKILPQVGEITAPDAGAGNRGMAIKLLAAYDVLVIARPNDGKADLAVARTPTDVTITNNGNSNVLLFDGESCVPATAPDQKEVCETVGSRRMYVGSTWQIPLKSAATHLKFKERRTAASDPVQVTF